LQPDDRLRFCPAARSVRTLVAVLVLALAGCAGNSERELHSGAEQVFAKARAAMESGNYRNAITYYEALEARYPFSNQAKQAQIDLIYVYYKNSERESAIDAAMQFERENPTHPRVDYALYMRGLANFRGQHGTMHKLLNVDVARRPPEGAREAFSAFSQLLQRYPSSPYAADARQRMIFLRNRLAAHENYVARYYLDRGAYVAALNRAQYAMQTFDGAPQVAESLRIIIAAYSAIGMEDLAEGARRVLAENFPDEALEQRKEEDKPWYRIW